MLLSQLGKNILTGKKEEIAVVRIGKAMNQKLKFQKGCIFLMKNGKINLLLI